MPRFLLPAVVAVACASPGFASDITLVSPDALDWKATPEGVAFAALTGDRFQNAYAAMVELPSGTASPLHTKSADMFGVMISGAMTHVAGVEPAFEVGPGGYYHIPGGLPHVSTCVSAEPCVTFLYQPGAFDFIPVTQ